MTPHITSQRRAGRAAGSMTPAGGASVGDGAADSVALSRLARRIATSTSAAAMLDQVAAGATTLLAAEGVIVARITGDGFHVDAATGSLIPMIGFQAPLAGTLAEEALIQGQPLVANDAATDPRVAVHFLTAFAPREIAIAPLVAGEAAQGFILALNSGRGGFDISDAATLQRLSDYGAIALRHAEELTRATVAADDARAVGDAIQEMNRSLELERVLATLAWHALTMCGARGARIVLVDQAGLSVAAIAGDARDAIGPIAEPDAYLAARALADRRAVRAPDLRAYADQWARPSAGRDGAVEGRANGVAVPLLIGERAIGAVTVFGKEGDDFDARDERVLQGLADHAAVAVENARLYRAAANMARHANVLAAVARSLASTTAEAVLAGVCEVAQSALGARGVSVFLADPATRHVDLAYSQGVGSDILNWTPNRFWALPTGAVTTSGTPHYAARGEDMHVWLTPEEVPRYRAAGIKSVALLPLPEGPQRGVLILRFLTRQSFDEPERRMLEDFAAQVAVAIRNAQLAEAERSGRERERALTASVHQTEKLAALGELVAGVAHELNNPLTGISAFAQLLLDEPLSEDQQEAAREIKREADRAVSVISDLLVFSRKTGPRQVPVDVNTVVRHTLKLRAYTLQSSGIEIKLELDPSNPAVLGDDRKLQQVLLNLVVNAEYAMRRSETRVLTLRTGAREVAGAMRATIDVTDTGAGMAPDVEKHIFEPFFTTKPPGVGTGLGLSVSYGIVQAHAGTIEVSTTPGTGSTFSVMLPLHMGGGPTPPRAGHASGRALGNPGDPSIDSQALPDPPLTNPVGDATGTRARLQPSTPPHAN